MTSTIEEAFFQQRPTLHVDDAYDYKTEHVQQAGTWRLSDIKLSRDGVMHGFIQKPLAY